MDRLRVRTLLEAVRRVHSETVKYGLNSSLAPTCGGFWPGIWFRPASPVIGHGLKRCLFHLVAPNELHQAGRPSQVFISTRPSQTVSSRVYRHHGARLPDEIEVLFCEKLTPHHNYSKTISCCQPPPTPEVGYINEASRVFLFFEIMVFCSKIVLFSF